MEASLGGDTAAARADGSGGAYFPGGSYCYEKHFPRLAAERVVLQFEGVYKNAKVYLNGCLAGGTAYGYLPFFVEADTYLTEGDNVIRVTCENGDQPDSRWYSGAGLYRPVWLWEGPCRGTLRVGIHPEARAARPGQVVYVPVTISVEGSITISSRPSLRA